MKKLMTITMAVLMMTAISGCFTSAYTVSEKTTPDGTKTYTKARVIGYGDKASEIAASGMFSDGSDDALGSGFKDANAKQESSGFEGSMNAFGNVIFAGVQLFEAVNRAKSLPSVTPTTAKPAVEVNGDAGSITSQPIANKSIPRSVITNDGGPAIVILGNRSECTLTSRLWDNLDANVLSAAVCDVSVIDADKTDNPKVYEKYRSTISGDLDWPSVQIYADGKLAKQFVARGMTQAQIATEANKFIGECADPAPK